MDFIGKVHVVPAAPKTVLTSLKVTGLTPMPWFLTSVRRVTDVHVATTFPLVSSSFAVVPGFSVSCNEVTRFFAHGFSNFVQISSAEAVPTPDNAVNAAAASAKQASSDFSQLLLSPADAGSG